MGCFAFLGEAWNGPTGFHLIMPLNRDISCSSVHASAASSGLGPSVFREVGLDSAGCGCSSCASLEIVEAALEERRVFFLGGIMMRVWITERQT